MKKRKLWFKIMAVLLAVLLLGSLGFTILASLISSARASDELDSLSAQQAENQREREALESQQAELARQKTGLQNTIYSLRNSIADMQQQKQEYDRLIGLTEEELVNLASQIDLLNQQIDYKRQQYEAAVAAEEAQWTVFRRKLRAMEEDGDISYYEILFEELTDFSDLLSRLDMIDELNARDEVVIREMETAKQEVVLAQQALYDAKDDCERKEEELNQKHVELDGLVEEASLRIRELEGEAAAQQADADSTAARIAELERQIRLSEEEDRAIAARIEELERLELLKNAGVTATGTYLWPSADSYYVTSLFGSRFHPILKTWRTHNGVDIGASYGTDIYASDGGVVITSEESYSYGNYVMIAHGDGRFTLYAHMSRRLVSVDDVVSQGDVIGLVGSTGYSTGPHIHFEIYENNERIDPLQFFSNYVVLD